MFGFEVKIDASWLVLAFIIIWSLAAGYFPSDYPGFSRSQYWLMGFLGAIGLFISIIIHEFCHSLVARKRGMKIGGITLFIFGGVSELEDQPESPKTEFLMAAAGPLASLLLSLIFYVLYQSFETLSPYSFTGIIFKYLATINLFLAIFNCLPGFPLDGGRMLRSILWARKKDILSATQTAARIGSMIGFILIVLGIFHLFTLHFVTGFWWIFMGLFLRGIALQSWADVLIRSALRDVPLEKFLDTTSQVLNPNSKLEEVLEERFYHHLTGVFPVVENGVLIGCLDSDTLLHLGPNERMSSTVREIMKDCADDQIVDIRESSLSVFSKLRRRSPSHVIVTDGLEFKGIVYLDSLIRYALLHARPDFQFPPEFYKMYHRPA
ncbi:MAG: peptidase [Bacteriovoracaceae bacterium]|nr:peptidase [Bacteriovoracaceae bacterium]